MNDDADRASDELREAIRDKARANRRLVAAIDELLRKVERTPIDALPVNVNTIAFYRNELIRYLRIARQHAALENDSLASLSPDAFPPTDRAHADDRSNPRRSDPRPLRD